MLLKRFAVMLCQFHRKNLTLEISKALKEDRIGVATGEVCQNRVMFKQFLASGGMQFCQIDSGLTFIKIKVLPFKIMNNHYFFSYSEKKSLLCLS